MVLTRSASLFEGVRPGYTELPDTKSEARGAARIAQAPTPYREHMTLYTNLMDRKAVDDGSRRIFGWRERKTPDAPAGDFVWVTFNEFLARVAGLSAGMVAALGLARQEVVGVFSKNRYEWALVEHCCNRMSYQLVPLYDTLGPTAVPYILNHTDMRVIFCGKQQLPALLKAVPECPSVRLVVQFEDVADAQREEARALGVELKSLREVEDAGKDSPVEADEPTPQDIATICYTSGTTGNPKGALLSHANLCASTAATHALNPMNADDVHLSYLPLAHVLERAVQTTLLRAGGSIGFFQGEVAKLTEDLAALQPTLFPSVPRVMNRIHDKVLQGVNEAGGVKKFLFETGYAAKKKNIAHGYVNHSFWDGLVFNKVKQILGGRIRIMMNGSAPISQDCKEFLQIVFGCPVIEGYGMTETCAVIALSTPQFAPGTHVGLSIPGLQVCLANVPEMNYTSEDKPCPRGEICVRGPNVFVGYHKEPEKTAEAVDADGWLHTGDIGCWNADGTLSIIDRKKNIFKLSQGEYVAPEKIENVYLKSALVAQIYVHGDSLQNFLVGIVVPEAEAVAALPSKDAGDIKKAIMADLEALAKTHGLFRFERVAKVHIENASDAWTIENDLVTPTFKLKRPQLLAKFQPQIDAMYAEKA